MANVKISALPASAAASASMQIPVNNAGVTERVDMSQIWTPLYVVSTITGNTPAVNGVTYLCDTTGGAFTLTLPSPVSGTLIQVKDPLGTFSTNNLTIARFAAENIENVAADYTAVAAFSSFRLLADGTNWFFV